MSKHLTTNDLAERWSCSVGWLMNQRSAGTGPSYIKLGAKVLYPVAAVEAFEAARVVELAQ